ncbi:MAG TPA: DUF4157 domain-containing protein [Chitinophagaceae bacterium]
MQRSLLSISHQHVKVYIRENAWVARLAAWKLGMPNVAIVFGQTIFLYNCSADSFLSNESWVRHELKHVEQYARYGFMGFILRYLAESITNGYHNNKYEKEARQAELLTGNPQVDICIRP